MAPNLKTVFVVGGTGAQGLPVVKCTSTQKQTCVKAYLRKDTALSDSGLYIARVLTRNKYSERAKQISRWPNVELLEGQQTSQQDLHKGFKGAWGAWINTDGFTIGEKNELFYGIRAYEIARHEGVQHYIYAATDYALQDMNWDENYHWGHNDAKGRC